VARTRSPRHSRVKGANGEREFRDVIREFGFTAERDGQTMVARFSGEPNLDVRHDIPGVHVEVKRQETYLIDKWLSQAEFDAEKESRVAGSRMEPWVVFRKSKQPWRAIVGAKWLLGVMRELVDIRRENFELKRRIEELENPIVVVPLRPRHTVPGELVREALREAGVWSVSTAEEWGATQGITPSAVVAIQRGKRANVAFQLADDIAVALGIAPMVWYNEWAEWYYPPDEEPGDGFRRVAQLD
jgi:plasmid maintenance system antidote protein VapI